MGKIVKLTDADASFVTLGVNNLFVTIKRGEEVSLDDKFVEALSNSRFNYVVVGDSTEDEELTGEAASGGVASPINQLAGGDNLSQTPPIETVDAVIPKVDQQPGGDNLVHANTSGGGEESQIDESADKIGDLRDQASDGTLKPFAVMGGGDADDAFNATSFVGGNVADILPLVDDLSVEQAKQASDAETVGKNRTTLLNALDAKINS